MTWIIVIPAWGDRALDYFQTTSLPSVQEALRYAGIKDAQFIVHTDDERRVRKLVGNQVTALQTPTFVSKYYALGACHQAAITRANPGDKIAIINADHCVSVELFEACERRFAEGKQLIMAAGTRTLSDKRPPIGVRSRDLLAWAWANRHPVITDAIWGTGHSPSLACIHFVEGDDEVVTRAFHLHPVAFVRHAGLKFTGITIDDGIVDSFPRDRVHVVTDADELALAECSPADYFFASRESQISIVAIARWAGKLKGPGHPRASAAHRWLLTHRIVIKGTGKDLGDNAVCNAVLGILDGE